MPVERAEATTSRQALEAVIAGPAAPELAAGGQFGPKLAGRIVSGERYGVVLPKGSAPPPA